MNLWWRRITLRVKPRLPLINWLTQIWACRIMLGLSIVGTAVCALPVLAYDQDSAPDPGVAVGWILKVGGCMVVFALAAIMQLHLTNHRYPKYPDMSIDIFNENKNLDE